jgi:transcriptional regulator with XRE-family HTH domain
VCTFVCKEKLTQEEFAELVGIGVDFFSLIERGINSPSLALERPATGWTCHCANCSILGKQCAERSNSAIVPIRKAEDGRAEPSERRLPNGRQNGESHRAFTHAWLASEAATLVEATRADTWDAPAAVKAVRLRLELWGCVLNQRNPQTDPDPCERRARTPGRHRQPPSLGYGFCPSSPGVLQRSLVRSKGPLFTFGTGKTTQLLISRKSESRWPQRPGL